MTQTADVLAHLQSGKSITPIEALNLYGIFRLAAVVYDLREMGHEILTEEVKTPNGKRHALYRMKDTAQGDMFGHV